MICKTLVGKLGPFEEIKVDSIEGKGSTFTFILY